MTTPAETINWFKAWGRAVLFAYAAAAAALSPSLYSERTRAVALRQVYFSAWQVLPGFTLFATLLSLVVIQITLAVARDFGLSQVALELVFRALVLEFVPLLTAFFVALRSGAAISTEIALMRVSGEIDDPRAADVEIYEREFVPRIAAAAISVISLTVVCGSIVMVMAYLVAYGFTPWGFTEYGRAVAQAFGPAALAGFALKCFAFGVVVAVIPISAGLSATPDRRSAPVAVMGGMVRLFFALGLIEMAALAVKYV